MSNNKKIPKILKLIFEYLISGFMSTVVFIILGLGLGYIVAKNLEPIVNWVMNFLGIG